MFSYPQCSLFLIQRAVEARINWLAEDEEDLDTKFNVDWLTEVVRRLTEACIDESSLNAVNMRTLTRIEKVCTITSSSTLSTSSNSGRNKNQNVWTGSG